MRKRQREDNFAGANNARIRINENSPTDSSPDIPGDERVGSPSLADTASDGGGSSAEGGSSSETASAERDTCDVVDSVAGEDSARSKKKNSKKEKKESSVKSSVAVKGSSQSSPGEKLKFDFTRAMMFIGLYFSRLEKLIGAKELQSQSDLLTREFVRKLSSALGNNDQSIELVRMLEKHLEEKEILEPNQATSTGSLIDIHLLALRTVLSRMYLESRNKNGADSIVTEQAKGLMEQWDVVCKILTSSCLDGQVGSSEVILVFEQTPIGYWAAKVIKGTTDAATTEYFSGNAKERVMVFGAEEILPFVEGLDVISQDMLATLLLDKRDEDIVIGATKIAEEIGAPAGTSERIQETFKTTSRLITRSQKLSRLRNLLQELLGLPYTLNSCVDAEALSQQIANFTRAHEDLEKSAKSAAGTARDEVLRKKRLDIEKLQGGLIIGTQKRSDLLNEIIDDAYTAGKAAAALVRQQRGLRNKLTGYSMRRSESSREENLRSSIEEGNIHALQSFLSDDEVDWMYKFKTNQQMPDGTIRKIVSTLLHAAVETNDPEVVKLVLEGMKEAYKKTKTVMKNIDKHTNSLNQTALHVAAKNLKVNVISELLKYTKDPNKTDNQGWTAFSYLATGRKDLDKEEETRRQLEALKTLIDWDEDKENKGNLRIQRCMADKQGKSALSIGVRILSACSCNVGK